MPLLGLRTWKSESDQLYTAVREGIKIRYHHIDCASVYGNEEKVGDAIRDAIQNHEVTRTQLWITAKRWSNCHGKDRVEAALNQSVQNLRMDDLCLYLIHWPVSIKPEKAFAESVDDLIPPEQSPSQVMLAWDVQRGISAIPKSVKPSRLLENMQVRRSNSAPARCKRLKRSIKTSAW